MRVGQHTAAPTEAEKEEELLAQRLNRAENSSDLSREAADALQGLQIPRETPEQKAAQAKEKLQARNRRSEATRSEKKQREREAQELRKSFRPMIPGSNQRRLPESQRMLYGKSREARRRLDGVFRRALQVDKFLGSHEFGGCDYCTQGWLGTREAVPGGYTKDSTQGKMNFLIARAKHWLDPVRPICEGCLREVLEKEKKEPPAPGCRHEPEELTWLNDMSYGDTTAALDALTYFEEQLLSPIQPVVRIFTLYGTGQTEVRGHVANWVQGGPEFVRDVPLKAKDAKILLVRRFPKDPNRKQRVPFVVSGRRLMAGLKCLLEQHRAFQKNGLHVDGVRVSTVNLDAYDLQGKEPEGMDVTVVEQRQDILLDEALFAKWIDGVYDGQLNIQVKVLLRDMLGEPALAEGEEEVGFASRAWPVLRKAVKEALRAAALLAEQKREAAEVSSGAAPPPPRLDEPAPAHLLRDKDLAVWLNSHSLKFEGTWDKSLDVLRDELTSVQEVEAFTCEPVDHSGTWDPENH